MDYEYKNFAFVENELVGNVYIRNNAGVEDCAKPCHLGTIEYITIASALSEILLASAFDFSEEEIASSWINYCKMKVSFCTYLDQDSSVRVWGIIKETEKDANSINGYQSRCQVSIAGVLIEIGIDHPANIRSAGPVNITPEVDITGLYVLGYKKRKHMIENVFCSIGKKTCSASIKVEDYFLQRKGIGVKYRAFIMPDIISIAGQLSQVLLYKSENTNRESANNMWLRECSIVYNRPFEKLQCTGNIAFSRFDEVLVKGDPWRCVALSSQIGGINAHFRIAHKINRE